MVIDKLIDENIDIIGYPRLIRLNPNIPWKTRGNGAISLQVGKGKGSKKIIGVIRGKEVYSYNINQTNNLDLLKLKDITEEIVNKYARLEDENTNSGFVIIDKQPIFDIYKNTITNIVTLEETQKLLNSNKAYFKGYKNSRGIIGATASIAWRNTHDKTYELITYRKKEKWGLERFVDNDSTKLMDGQVKSTFDNYDYENNHNRLVPNSPCPVLFGIRGDNDNDLNKAKSIIKSEDINSWIIFETNQGTDDHLSRKTISEIKPYESVIVAGKISKSPITILGGHVIFSIKDSTGEIDCAAYEPTKQFRNIIRKLIVGDSVEVFGGVRNKPLTINLEKINVIHLNKLLVKVENPICPKCGKHMKSIGTGQGFKCKKCKIKDDKPIIKEKNREIKEGFYEVPVCARRHISKPLKRY
jgi:tRNA(Ile2)-agmatinylcytidine synthase